ncbi:unnamed protein product [Blepharisma stoltei]|uniref:Uncharacterized protein n=1 Tax=Blepharisma stoltei TaxID=1481888 RepID=A0AAU9J0K6_9CILI|nr:unnamed protein product [Blepharisma stoltei]
MKQLSIIINYNRVQQFEIFAKGSLKFDKILESLFFFAYGAINILMLEISFSIGSSFPIKWNFHYELSEVLISLLKKENLILIEMHKDGFRQTQIDTFFPGINIGHLLRQAWSARPVF